MAPGIAPTRVSSFAGNALDDQGKPAALPVKEWPAVEARSSGPEV